MPILFIGNQPDPKDRLQIEVDKAEDARDMVGKQKWFRDIRTGTEYLVEPTDCGIPGCNCALKLVGIRHDTLVATSYSSRYQR